MKIRFKPNVYEVTHLFLLVDFSVAFGAILLKWRKVKLYPARELIFRVLSDLCNYKVNPFSGFTPFNVCLFRLHVSSSSLFNSLCNNTDVQQRNPVLKAGASLVSLSPSPKNKTGGVKCVCFCLQRKDTSTAFHLSLPKAITYSGRTPLPCIPETYGIFCVNYLTRAHPKHLYKSCIVASSDVCFGNADKPKGCSFIFFSNSW